MQKSRLEMLEEFVRERPTDSFSHYGLALEYTRLGRTDEALQIFQKLLAFNPDYAAAYYQAATLLGKLGRMEEARSLLERGMEVAGRHGDPHTRSEMEQALHDLST
jgi:tetratricopeptide (TPR) repeat protein